MHRTKPRSIAIARRSDDIQPASILATLGMIMLLMLTWTSLVL